MQQFARHLIVLALALSLGLHWTVLQSVAWASMFLEYASQGSVTEALVKTFDGKNPCNICIAVAEGKQSEQGEQKSSQLGKLDWLMTVSTVSIYKPVFASSRVSKVPMHALSLPAPPGPPPEFISS